MLGVVLREMCGARYTATQGSGCFNIVAKRRMAGGSMELNDSLVWDVEILRGVRD